MIDQFTLPTQTAQKPILISQFSVEELTKTLPLPDLPLRMFDPESCKTILDQFQLRLYLLRMDISSAQSLSNDDIESFTRYLLSQQRLDKEPGYAYGSWSLIRYKALPREVAYDFVYQPSQLAVAWLALVKSTHSDVYHRIKGGDRALSAGLRFIARTGLKGHGFESSKQLVSSVELLAVGAVFSLCQNTNRYPAFKLCIERTKETIYKELSEVRTWSKVEAPRLRRALDLISGMDADDAVVCPDLWEAITSAEDFIRCQNVLRTTPDIVAENMYADVAESVIADLKQIECAFNMELPKYTVFKSRRKVQSKPIVIDRYFQFESALRSGFRSVTPTAWTGTFSETRFLFEYGEAFWSRVAERLSARLKNDNRLAGLAFDIRIQTITEHGADGFLINLIATE